MNTIERIKQLQLSPNRDTIPELSAAYRSLTEEQGQLLARYAVGLIDETYYEIGDRRSKASRLAEDFLLHLACLVPGSLDGLHGELLARNVFYPPELYRGAAPNISAALLATFLENIDSMAQSILPVHLLEDLAWIGDANAQNAFRDWRTNSPEWRSHMSVAPEKYTQEAGWYLTDEGERRLLYNPVCHALVPSENVPESEHPNPVQVSTTCEEKCEWCGRSLATLFDFDLRDARLAFLGLIGTRLRIVLCRHCSVYSPIFMNTDLQGGSRWNPYSMRPEFIGQPDWEFLDLPQHPLVFGPRRKSPFEAHQFVTWGAGSSQIGGHPMWVQHSEYPVCPECQQLMPCLGHLSEADLDYGDGVWYAFYCARCQISTVGYQSS